MDVCGSVFPPVERKGDRNGKNTSTRGTLMEVSREQPKIIEAEPEPLTVHCSETAVIVVDMQNDFCSKGGLFDRTGIDISAVQKAVGPTRKVVSAARESGIEIVYLKMGFRADLSDLGDTDSVNRVRHLHLVVGQPCIASDGR
jgi:ureidoacrylate peracid hydrolase